MGIKRHASSDAPLRICHVIGRMNRAGAESMIMNLYRSIDRDKVQFDFLVHTPEESDFDDEIRSLGGTVFHLSALTPRSFLSAGNTYGAFFAEHRFAAVHGHLGSMAAWYLKAASRFGMPTIAHSHARNMPLDPEEALFRVMSYRTRFVADYFLACSEAAGRDRFGAKVVQSDRFHVLYNGFDTASYAYDSENRAAVRAELGIDAAAPVIGHVGRLTAVKNHRFLFRCFKQVLERVPQARLVLAGRGEEEERLKTYARELGIADAVVFAGLRDDINRLLCAFDAFVFPSVREGLGLSAVEAQASGLECFISSSVPPEAFVVSNAHSLSLESGESAWADALVDVLRRESSKNERERFDVRNPVYRTVAEHGYDISQSARWLEKFYRQISR